jgi:putative holliday junction resolvase
MNGEPSNSEEPTSNDSNLNNPSIPNETKSKDDFPTFGALFALDFGTKRIGVAVCNESQSIACPLENYARKTKALDAQWLTQLARGYQIVGLVVGLPVHMSGDEGGKAKEAREFGEWAAATTGLALKFWDERYSSAIADMHLHATNLNKKKKKARRDQVAAQVFLQHFLDSPDRNAAPASM